MDSSSVRLRILRAFVDFRLRSKSPAWLDRYELKGDEQSKDVYREQVY